LTSRLKPSRTYELASQTPVYLQTKTTGGDALKVNGVNSGAQHETDREAEWDRWLALHAPKLLLFARQQTRCEADARELLQDAVVEAWRGQDAGRPPEPGRVFGLIRRRAIDLARSRDRRAHRELAAQEAATPEWFGPEIEDRERARLAQDALRQLPADQRDVVTLRIWGGLTFAEIAVALEIPANTAASRYRYALAELRKRTREVFA
jgi:RNA polymerase sigma-70 factor (ECF subfamily)